MSTTTERYCPFCETETEPTPVGRCGSCLNDYAEEPLQSISGGLRADPSARRSTQGNALVVVRDGRELLDEDRPPAISFSGLVELYLFPSRFFARNGGRRLTASLFVATYLVSLDDAVARITDRLASGASALPPDWAMVWLLAGALALVGSFLQWALRGWFFQARIRWSGSPDPEPRAARAVLFHASLVLSLPSLLVFGALSLATVDAVELTHPLWDLSYLTGFLFIWSCVTAYRGVRAAFEVRPAAARLWFLGLPIGTFLSVFGIAVALADGT